MTCPPQVASNGLYWLIPAFFLFLMTTPSDSDLFQKARALIRQSGPDFAKTLAKGSAKPTSLAFPLFAYGDLGPNAPEKEIVEIMRGLPLLWEEDDQSDAYLDQARSFFRQVNQSIEAMGPSIFRVEAPALHENADDEAKALAAVLDGDHKELLFKIRKTPEFAAKSVLTRLAQQAVAWENSLIFLSKSAVNEDQAQLMCLIGSAARKGIVGELFNADDMAKIAELSTSVWLKGQHRDLEALRLRSADQLDTILNDPMRRETAIQTLGEHLPALAVPPLMNESKRLERIQNAREFADGVVEMIIKQLDSDFSPQGIQGAMIAHIQKPNWKDSFSESDWLSLGRQIKDGQASEVVDDALAQLFFDRVMTVVLAKVPLEHLAPPQAEQAVDPPPSPKPR